MNEIKRISLTTIMVILFLGMANGQSYVDYYNQGIAHYNSKEYEKFAHAFIKADSLRPNHRVILYNLAIAHTLNNTYDKAFEVLNHLIEFYAESDFKDDEHFLPLREKREWEQLVNKVQEYNTEKIKSEVAFTLTIDEFHPEGISFNSQNLRFYFSDIRHGMLLSTNIRGEDVEEIISLRESGYWSAMGIAVDPIDHEKLWVTTSVVENFSGFEDSLKGKAAILRIDLSKGKIDREYPLDGDHILGDLIVSSEGNVYVTDSNQPIIYQLDKEKNKLVEFYTNDSWWNLQGLALSEDESILYVSDYIIGIYQIELKNKSVRLLGNGIPALRGADGLYQKEGKLVLLQNGTSPKRVSILDASNSENIFSIVDRNRKGLSEPTLGTWVGEELYYIGNSPWSQYDENMHPIKEGWSEIIIFKLSIK